MTLNMKYSYGCISLNSTLWLKAIWVNSPGEMAVELKVWFTILMFQWPLIELCLWSSETSQGFPGNRPSVDLSVCLCLSVSVWSSLFLCMTWGCCISSLFIERGNNDHCERDKHHSSTFCSQWVLVLFRLFQVIICDSATFHACDVEITSRFAGMTGN